jgi:hypothetical protein
LAAGLIGLLTDRSSMIGGSSVASSSSSSSSSSSKLTSLVNGVGIVDILTGLVFLFLLVFFFSAAVDGEFPST